MNVGCKVWRHSVPRGVGRAICCGVVLLAWQTASAQFESGFEAPTYVGDADGEILNGQDFFYQPVPGSDSFLVYTYAANALGLPQNPRGGEQFVGGTGPGGGVFARSQRDMTYGDGTGTWTSTFDIAITYTGVPGDNVQNIGSFSTQVFPEDATFIALSRWTAEGDATSWNADYVWFDAAGTQLIEEVPDLGFQGLASEHWYRWSTTFNFDTNEILEVSITDLTTNVTATHNPVGRFLLGGAAGAPTPDGFRFFAGSLDVQGNTMAFDNLSIVPAPAALPLLALAALIARRHRR